MHRELGAGVGPAYRMCRHADPNIAESLPFMCLRFRTGSIVTDPSLCRADGDLTSKDN